MRIDNRKLDLVLARKCKNISELRCVTSPQTITRIRAGEDIKPVTLGKIATYLCCDPEDLLRNTGE